jgi:hypothetical protein
VGHVWDCERRVSMDDSICECVESQSTLLAAIARKEHCDFRAVPLTLLESRLLDQHPSDAATLTQILHHAARSSSSTKSAHGVPLSATSPSTLTRTRMALSIRTTSV